MKFLSVLLSVFLLACAPAIAGDMRDYDFQQERMLITSDNAVIVASSFEYEDAITAYDFYGTRLWETRFGAKIVSWQKADHYIFVFSKARGGYKTFLTCLDARSGYILWERP